MRGSSTTTRRKPKRGRLEEAVKKFNKEAIMTELAMDPNLWQIRDNEGRTMLHLLLECGDHKRTLWLHRQVGRRFSDRQRLRPEPRCTVQQALMEITKIFLDLGVDVNSRDNKGDTPLSIAIKERLDEVAKYLIERGADWMVKNKGENLAHMIVKNEIHHRRATRNQEDSMDSPHHRSLSTRFWDWLLSKGIDVDSPNDNGETAYRWAITGNLRSLSLIFAKYSHDLKFTNSEGQNILHILLGIDKYYDPYVFDNITDILQTFLAKGVPVNAIDNNGRTPLHSFAYFSPSEEIIRTLISNGADIFMKNENGMTPLQLAVLKHEDERTLRVLQENRADFNICTDEGDTLLHLLSGTKMEFKTDSKLVDYLVKQGCPIDAPNVHGYTPLHLAVMTGCETLTKSLLKNKAHVNCRESSNQMTALHLAVHHNKEEMVEVLVKAGCDVDSKDANGKTPLHLATSRPSSLINALIKSGAVVDVKDNNGHLPLHDVLLNDNSDGLDCLLAGGADINDIGTVKQIPFIENIKNKSVWNRVLEQLVMLKVAKMPISPVLQPFIDISSNHMKTFHKECLQELAQMKKVMIDGRRSIYDLLLMDPYQRYAHVRSIRFKVLHISPCYFETAFRKYACLIRSCYKESIERKPLMEPAKSSWYQLTNINLPDICVERIIAHLNNGELKTMIEGAEEMEMET